MSKRRKLYNNVYSFIHHNIYYLVNGDTKKWVICNKTTIDCLNSIYFKDILSQPDKLCDFFGKENYEILSKKGFFALQNEAKCNNKVFILHMTNSCNMRCKYCYVKQDRAEQAFPIKRLIYILNELDVSTFDNLTINFHGGEPLLCYDEIKQIVTTINLKTSIHKASSVHYRLQTNGTLIRDDMLSFFLANNFYISISLDGPLDVNDVNRRFFDNSGTYDVVLSKIMLIKKRGVPFQVIATVDEKSDYRNIVLHFAQKGIYNIKFSFLTDELIQARYGYVEQSIMASKYIDLLNWIISHNQLSKIKVHLNNISLIVKQLLMINCDDSCLNRRCNAGQGIFSIDNEGIILPCDNYRLITNSKEYILESLNTNTKKINALFNNHLCKSEKPITLSNECEECGYIFLCGGGCMAESIAYSKNSFKQDFLCLFKKEIFDYLFEILNKDSTLLINLL